MTNVFNRYATPLITGLFLVSLISGIALFLHIGPPQFQLAHRVMSQSLPDVAPALGATPQAVAARLTAAGFTVADGQTLTEIAAASGKSQGDLAAALLGAGS